MGTSKGYIAPTRDEWRKAKSAVTSATKKPESTKILLAIGRFIQAIGSDYNSQKSNGEKSTNKETKSDFDIFVEAVAKTIFIGLKVQNDDPELGLKELNLDYLLSYNNINVSKDLISNFCKKGSTRNGNLAYKSITDALDTFNIIMIEEFSSVDLNDLLMLMIVNYIKINFSSSFEEKINKELGVKEGKKRLEKFTSKLGEEIKKVIGDIKLDKGKFELKDLIKHVDRVLTESFKACYNDMEA